MAHALAAVCDRYLAVTCHCGANQGCRRYLQRLSDHVDQNERDVLLAPLDRADVGPVNVGGVGQLLLTHATAEPNCAYMLAELALPAVGLR